jgi:hypothetical protein
MKTSRKNRDSTRCREPETTGPREPIAQGKGCKLASRWRRAPLDSYCQLGDGFCIVAKSRWAGSGESSLKEARSPQA